MNGKGLDFPSRMAVSNDNGASFRKLGTIITGSLPKDVKGRSDQGCGDLCAVGRSRRS